MNCTWKGGSNGLAVDRRAQNLGIDTPSASRCICPISRCSTPRASLLPRSSFARWVIRSDPPGFAAYSPSSPNSPATAGRQAPGLAAKQLQNQLHGVHLPVCFH